MHVIFERNAASSLASAISALRRGNKVDLQVGDKVVPHRQMPFAFTVVLGHPAERTIPWPWWHRNPFAAFLGGLQAVVGIANAFTEATAIDAQQTVEYAAENGGSTCQSLSFKKSPHGKLDLVVFERARTDLGRLFGVSMCRSTMLHEYMAAHLKLPIGVYSHVVCDLLASEELMPIGGAPDCAYGQGIIKPYDMVGDSHPRLVRDAAMLLGEGPVMGISDPFVRHVAIPIFKGCQALSTGESEDRFGKALEAVGKCRASDWRFVCEEYVRQQVQQWLMAQVPDPAAELLN